MPDGASSAGQTVAAGLTDRWNRARAGDADLRCEWQVAEGGGWAWDDDGVTVCGDYDWTALAWTHLDNAMLRRLGCLTVEVTISGDAAAAGLSLGHYRDFLTEVRGGRCRRMRLDLDLGANRWTCTVDGVRISPWWDTGGRQAADVRDSCLTFKAHTPGTVRFEDLVVTWLDRSCQISIIMTCHRFLQRLRVSLQNWCLQSTAPGALEILIVNPASPDGTHEHLSVVSRVFEHVRVIEIPANPSQARNKGVLINQAVSCANGAWVWLTDADCVFRPGSASLVLSRIASEHGRPKLLYGRRLHMKQEAAEGLLAGRYDAVRDYDVLAEMATAQEAWPWGYTQIAPRSVFQRIRYDESQDHFAHSDGLFVAACQRNGIPTELIEGLECLHVVHPFVWYGNDGYL